MTELTKPSNLPWHEFVYLILSYGKVEQLFRLIRTLRATSPNSAILLHHDAKSPPLDECALRELDGVYSVVPRVEVQWGDNSFLDAYLHSIAYALKNLDFSWLSVISGQDYPLRPLATIETELRVTHYDAFVKAAPVKNGPYHARYYLHYRPLPRFRYAYRIPRWLRAAFNWGRQQLNLQQSLLRIEGGPHNTPLRLGIRTIRHPFSDALLCYKGSDWFTCSHRALTHLIAFGQHRPEVLEYFRHTFIPSESYFQTVLWNCKELKVCDDNRRFIVWKTSRVEHPKTLTFLDLDAITRSGKDFGRKFDAAVDSAVLGR
ncbi:beta-1,6-N-acetylglucosaminyltransferase [Candidatus Nitrotoga sp. 1052]|uniref:beta-1,6-N-acetylglucosaminyltransferase n=1 Tax=Candidatus Nitrotoga sp. 1052 TaxID=2886964 RepID=UPI001EF6C8F5|nr:beta-1,6-N-acetylglucosaminyltransferase [Candidatus Nitrotoga sp. 1052]CAH1087234.1 conserved hypothetical protein [Candidatus Nitrotoga sp. 1052]